MAFGATGNGTKSEINITPLVDVVLVLLIIFMVATPMLQMGLDVEVPPKVVQTTPPPENQRPQLLVLVRADGLYLNAQKLDTAAALHAALAEQLAARPENERVVFINSEDALTFDRAVAAMDAAQAAGATKVGFLTDAP